jgi:hypothetical protein
MQSQTPRLKITDTTMMRLTMAMVKPNPIQPAADMAIPNLTMDTGTPSPTLTLPILDLRTPNPNMDTVMADPTGIPLMTINNLRDEIDAAILSPGIQSFAKMRLRMSLKLTLVSSISFEMVV